MTLSLSSCFRPSVRPSPFFLLVPMEFSLILKSFHGVARKFKGCLKFKGCFKEVLKGPCHRNFFFPFVFLKFLLVLKSFKGVSRQFKECLKVNGSIKAVSRKF